MEKHTEKWNIDSRLGKERVRVSPLTISIPPLYDGNSVVIGWDCSSIIWGVGFFHRRRGIAKASPGRAEFIVSNVALSHHMQP